MSSFRGGDKDDLEAVINGSAEKPANPSNKDREVVVDDAQSKQQTTSTKKKTTLKGPKIAANITTATKDNSNLH